MHPRNPPLDDGSRVRARGEHWTVLHTGRGLDCRSVTLLPEANRAMPVRTLLEPFDRVTQIEFARRPHLVHPRRWLHAVRRHCSEMRPAGAFRAVPPPPVALLDWQLEPALALVKYGTSRILIADGVGLGKTVQAGILIHELRSRSEATRVLVLVPAGLRQQWLSELHTLFGVDAIDADARWLGAAARNRPAGVNPWELPGVYICSHDFAKRPEVLRPLEDARWDALVLDEAHAAALHTQRRAAADAIACRSRLMVLLTATPHSDAPEQFDALCRLGRIATEDRGVVLFRRSRMDVGSASARRTVLLPVHPSEAERRMLQLLDTYTERVWVEARGRNDQLAGLVSVVLRKRSLSSAGSLVTSLRRRIDLLNGQPETEEIQLRLPLIDEDPLDDDAPSAALLGVPGLSNARRERRWLASIAEAAQLAARNETKLRCVVRLVRRLREPAIVFTEYRETLVRLQRALASNGIQSLAMHGGLAARERGEVQRIFNAEPHILLATDAASEGLNLHARCRVIIHFELPWSVSRLEQRAGRVDRFGQRRRVHEVLIVAADTAERFVLAPLARRAIRAAAMNGSDRLAAALSESRVAEMVLGRTPPPDPALPRTCVISQSTTDPPEGLRQEAAAEARRLGMIRDCIARSGIRASAADLQVVASIERRRSALPVGCTFLYRIALRSPDGDVLSIVPSLITRPAHDRTARLNARELRMLALAPPDEQVRHQLAQAVEAALQDVMLHTSRFLTTRQPRSNAMRLVESRVARQLVQGGLFDRRASPNSHPRESSRIPLDPDPFVAKGANPARPPIAGIDVVLLAVLHVYERTRK